MSGPGFTVLISMTGFFFFFSFCFNKNITDLLRLFPQLLLFRYTGLFNFVA